MFSELITLSEAMRSAEQQLRAAEVQPGRLGQAIDQ